LVKLTLNFALLGGGPEVTPGTPLPAAYREENVELVEKGCSNLNVHIQNLNKFGVPVIVAINQFSSDTERELNVVKEQALKSGAKGKS